MATGLWNQSTNQSMRRLSFTISFVTTALIVVHSMAQSGTQRDVSNSPGTDSVFNETPDPYFPHANARQVRRVARVILPEPSFATSPRESVHPSESANGLPASNTNRAPIANAQPLRPDENVFDLEFAESSTAGTSAPIHEPAIGPSFAIPQEMLTSTSVTPLPGSAPLEFTAAVTREPLALEPVSFAARPEAGNSFESKPLRPASSIIREQTNLAKEPSDAFPNILRDRVVASPDSVRIENNSTFDPAQSLQPNTVSQPSELAAPTLAAPTLAAPTLAAPTLAPATSGSGNGNESVQPQRSFTVSEVTDSDNSFAPSNPQTISTVANGANNPAFQSATQSATQSGFGSGSRQTRSGQSSGSGSKPSAFSSGPRETATPLKPNPLPGEPSGSGTKPTSITPVSGTNASQNSSFELFRPGHVLAEVGGHPIFVGDVLFEVNQRLEQGLVGAPPEVKDKYRMAMIQGIVPKYIDSKMLYVAALEDLPEGVDVDTFIDSIGEEFDKTERQEMMKQSGCKSPLELDAYFRTHGSSLRKYRHWWSEDQMTKLFLSRKLQIDTDVTHQDMIDYYREHITEFEFKGKVRWEQIMIRFDQAGGRSAAQKEIVEIGNKIVYGANFAETAKKNSHGFNASSGGQHDWLTRGSLVWDKVDDAIFTMPVGQLSDLIESQDGFHIVRVIERTESGHTPFLEAQVDIKKKLIAEKRNGRFREHLADLKNRIPVEIYEFNPKDFQAQKTLTSGGPINR